MVEVLNLAFKQDSALRGVQSPGISGQRRLFSAVVDVSTLFLDKAKQLSHAVRLIKT